MKKTDWLKHTFSSEWYDLFVSHPRWSQNFLSLSAFAATAIGLESNQMRLLIYRRSGDRFKSNVPPPIPWPQYIPTLSFGRCCSMPVKQMSEYWWAGVHGSRWCNYQLISLTFLWSQPTIFSSPMSLGDSPSRSEGQYRSPLQVSDSALLWETKHREIMWAADTISNDAIIH